MNPRSGLSPNRRAEDEISSHILPGEKTLDTNQMVTIRVSSRVITIHEMIIMMMKSIEFRSTVPLIKSKLLCTGYDYSGYGHVQFNTVTVRKVTQSFIKYIDPALVRAYNYLYCYNIQ